MEEKKKLKITNQKQFERLVNLMERNPEIARGFAKTGTTKLDIKQAWEDFAVEINSFGPPLRSGKEWQKVWIDYKAKVKKAVAAKKKALKETGFIKAVDNIDKRKFKIQDIELKNRELDLKQEELMLMGKKNGN